MPVTELDSAQFANMLRGGYENLKQNAARINDLNVFPYSGRRHRQQHADDL